MASGTSMLPFADAEIKMRWREPYVTEGLNKKLAGVVPRGIYRGFSLGFHGANMLVRVLVDPDKGDHVAVYETDTGMTTRYSMRVERTGGDFTLDLTPWPSQLVYIAIYAEYSTLGTTAASLRVYTEAEYAGAAEKDELVILGTVQVPALGNPVPAASITSDLRTYPWRNAARDAVPWQPLLKNGSFDDGPMVNGLGSGTGGILSGRFRQDLPHWEEYRSIAAPLVADVQPYNVATGAGQAYHLRGSAAAAYAFRWGLIQDTWIEVSEGQELILEFWYKSLFAKTGGQVWVQVCFANEEQIGGTPVMTWLTLDDDLDLTVTVDWVRWSKTLRVPSGVSRIRAVSIGSYDYATKTAYNLQYTTAGAESFLLIDEVQLFHRTSVAVDVDSFADRRFDVASFRTQQWSRFLSTLGNTAQGFEDPVVLEAVEWNEDSDTMVMLQLDRADHSLSSARLPRIGVPAISVGDPNTGDSRSNAFMDRPKIRFRLAEKAGWKYQSLFSWAEEANNPPTSSFYAKRDSGTNYLVYAHSCYWNAGTELWTRASSAPFKMEIGGYFTHPISAGDVSGIVVGHRRETDTTWADAAWYPSLALPLSVKRDVIDANLTGWLAQYGGGLELGNHLKYLNSLRSVAALVPRLKTRRDITSRTLIFEHTQESGTFLAARLYQEADGQLSLVHNARWDGTNWIPDSSAANYKATRVLLGGYNSAGALPVSAGLVVQEVSTDAVFSFADSAWGASATGTGWAVQRNLADSVTGDLYAMANTSLGAFLGIWGNGVVGSDYTSLKVHRSNFSWDDAGVDSNSLYSSNIPKMWVLVRNTAVPGVNFAEGFNLASITFPDNLTMRLTFRVPMANANYCVTGSVNYAGYLFGVLTKTTTYVDVYWWNTGTASVVNFTSDLYDWGVCLFGKQN